MRGGDGQRGTTVTVMATGKVDGWVMVTGDYEGQWRPVKANSNGDRLVDSAGNC